MTRCADPKRFKFLCHLMLVLMPWTASGADFIAPSWSPDGQWIAFASDLDGHMRLHAARLDGSDLKRLSRRHGVDDVAWSPAGPDIAFGCTCGWRGRPELYLLNASSGEERRIETAAPWDRLSRPAWSPSGQRLAFVAQARTEDGVNETAVMVQEMGLGGATWTINHQRPIAAVDFAAETTLVLTGTLDGAPQLWLYPEQEARMVRLLSTHGFESGPARVGPRQKRIVFSRARRGSQDWELALFDMERSELRALTNTLGSNYAPAWSPDGTRIAFETTRNGSRELIILDLANGEEMAFSQAVERAMHERRHQAGAP